MGPQNTNGLSKAIASGSPGNEATKGFSTEMASWGLDFENMHCAVAIVPGQPVVRFINPRDCRAAVSGMPDSVTVIVNNNDFTGEITPINLAAALCQDNPFRDVYLLEDNASGSLVSRARSAGVRGVIDHYQLEELLNGSQQGRSTPGAVGGGGGAAATGGGAGSGAAAAANGRILDPGHPEALNAGGKQQPMALFEIEESHDLEEPANYPSQLQEPANYLSLLQEPANNPSLLEEPVNNPSLLASKEAPAFLVDSTPSDSGQIKRTNSVIGVFSGRGGVGKSTVSLLLALLASRRGLSVALVDADLQFGDIAYLLGRQDSQTTEVHPLLDYCQGNCQHGLDLSEIGQASLSHKRSGRQPASGKLLVLTAPEHVEQSELIADALPGLMEALRGAYDLLLINTSAYWNSSQAFLARACTQLLFLMDQRASSIKACQRVVELCVKLQIPEARYRYVLNGCGRYAPLTPQDAALALGNQEVIALEDGGFLVDELLALGCPQELLTGNNAFIKSLEQLLSRLVDYQTASLADIKPAAAAHQGGLSKILSHFKVPAFSALFGIEAANVSA